MSTALPDARWARIGASGGLWRNLQRITSIRIVVQAITFGLFLSFVLLNTFANLDRLPGLRLWVSKVLEIDPLIALATALTTHTVYKGLLWSLVILIPTLFLGRFFCGWICPYGTLHHFVGWLFAVGARKDSRTSERVPPLREPLVRESLLAPPTPHRYRPSQQVKYYILVALLVLAALGMLQIGLLDPICLIYRSFTGAVLPAANMPAGGLRGDDRIYGGAWLIGSLLFGLVAMNLVYPRFFCRVLCPLGALLGVLSRFAWWRIERDPDACHDCNSCRLHCEGACDPHARLRKAECFVCFNCIEECPEGALRFALLPPREHEIAGPDASRRKLIFAGVTGLLFYPFVRASGRVTRDFSSRVIRPPGAVEELEFLKRCVACDQCARVCPTNVIQPSWFESGLEGLWSPLLNFRLGHCQLHCTACGQVCPTGAIQRISVSQKLGLGAFADVGPVRLGTAHIDLGRCLPYSAGIPCQVCEEVCPTSPKAIRAIPLPVGWALPLVRESHLAPPTPETLPQGVGRAPTVGGGQRPPYTPELKVPRVDLSLCIGCGLCERQCPVVGDRRAIYVTAEGETRSAGYPERDRNRSVRLPA